MCIKMMDDHIRNCTVASSIHPKPSICYEEFLKTELSNDIMTKEISNIVEKFKNSDSVFASSDELTKEIMDKIKKTYKNRYYKYISSAKNKN